MHKEEEDELTLRFRLVFVIVFLPSLPLKQTPFPTFNSFLCLSFHSIPFSPHRAGKTQTKQTVSDLLSSLPVYLDYENALRIVGAGANSTPVCEALLAEVRTYNAILGRIKSDCDCLVRMLTGATNELLDESSGRWSVLLAALQQNTVPKRWAEGGAQETRPCVRTIRLSLADWMLQLRERVRYLRRWTETGQLPAEIVLGRFNDPRRFLNGVLQVSQRLFF